MLDSFQLELSEEQRLVAQSALEFASESVAKLAKKVDAEHYFPSELIPQMAELGFFGVCVSDEYGGVGLDSVSYALIVESLARYCASTSVIVSAHNSLCLFPLEKFGSEQQKKKYLPELCMGKKIGCFALSEPGTGSDAAAQSCRSEKKGEKWIINGVKNWITNGPVADICILFTMGDPEKRHKGINCFIVDLKNTKGVEVGKKEDKLGICGSPTSNISFDNVELTDDDMLGGVGEGFKIAMQTLDGGRIGIGAQAVGIARAALEESVSYSKERKAFGKAICEHQTIQNYLADMATEIDAARLLVMHAAKRKDAGLNYSRQAAQAKLFASEVAMKTTVKGVQVHGGYGFVKEYNLERYMRDAKITEIYEGTSEIQRLVIASNILKEL